MSEDQVIRITCQGASTVPYDSLIPFQGNLKDLHEDQYQKLRDQIVQTGFSAPLIVWKNDGKMFLMDGHQRLRVIKHLVEKEGWTCPRLPVDWVQAISIQEAYRKCLSLASTYGRTSDQGLYEFMAAAGMGADDMNSFNFLEIKAEEFSEEFFTEPSGDGADVDQGDLGRTDPKTEGPTVTCPKCGHEFQA